MKKAYLVGRIFRLIVFLITLSPMSIIGYSQDGTSSVSPEGNITLNLTGNIELKILIEYVSQRLDINIIYDHHVEGKWVTIQAPKSIQQNSLIDLLQSVLRMNGLMLVDTKDTGWMRVVQDENYLLYCTPAGEGESTGKLIIVSQIMELKHLSYQSAEKIIRPFLSKPGGNLISIDNIGKVIVTDYYRNVERIEKMIRLADVPKEGVKIEFYPVKYLEASPFANQLQSLLMAKQKQINTDIKEDPPIEILVDERTNRLTLIGRRETINEAFVLAAEMDVPLDLKTKVYTFQIASPVKVDQLIKNLIGELQVKLHYKSAIDTDTNLLVVTTTPEIHTQLQTLIEDLDRPLAEAQIPIRFYKLQNAKSENVLKTIRLMESTQEFTAASVEPEHASNSVVGAGAKSKIPLSFRSEPQNLQRAMRDSAINDLSHDGETLSRVLADRNTNTIIVIAEPSIQRLYEKLIQKLDCRRPQVLIEVTLVALDTSGGFSFGVDVSTTKKSLKGDGDYLVFNSFGLSEVNSDTGSLEMIPGVGFNGAVLGADMGDVVLKALQSEAKARVLSAPRLLINDNATGTLSAVSEIPFTSINASETVATTSFSGFTSAGTSITITPHISERDHLSLEYTINHSSFSGEGANGIPPPRQTDEISSEVTVPHGHMIVIGGLKRFDSMQTRESIPIIGDIPLLGSLFGNESTNESETSLFVFIRPIILRDDEFRDLKYLSAEEADSSGIGDGYPKSEPMVIRLENNE